MAKLKARALEATTRFLGQRGYEILDKSFPLKSGGKIDFVAKDGNDLVFIDVHVRSDTEKGFPSEVMSEAKIRRLEAGAIQWLSAHADEGYECPVRFDTIALIVVGTDKALLRHHINALRAPHPNDYRNALSKDGLACATA